MSKERRLGRGLEALLGQLPGWGAGGIPPGQSPAPTPASPVSAPSLLQPSTPESATASIDLASLELRPEPAPAVPADAAPHGQKVLAIHLIEHNPNQPRQDFDPDEIQRLADSIVEHGLLQPVVVRRVDDHYQLIAGERRLRAARQAGWVEVPVNVIEADDRQSAELAIIENLQRKDLSALEKAASFQRYLEQYDCTQEELAGRLNLDRSTIANLIRLLELPEPVQDALRRGKITPGHARALLPLGEEREQIAFCERIQKDGLNVRQTEYAVQASIEEAEQGHLKLVGSDKTKGSPRRGKADNLAALEQEFRASLGVRVKITHDARGRGKLVIQFADHEEFERLRQHICGPGRPMVQVQAG